MFENNYELRGKTIVAESGRVSYSDSVAQRFMTSVYLWMAGAMAITGFAAILTVGISALNPAYTSQEAYQIATGTAIGQFVFGNRFGYIILAVLELGLVIYLSARIAKMSRTAAMIAFFAFATVNGATLSSIFLVYSLPSIGTAFFIAAGMFAGMSVFGMVTKKDLTKVGNICSMALFGIIIASIVNMFMRSPAFSYIVSFVTVIVFTGLTAYHTQKFKAMQDNIVDNGTDMVAKMAILGALTLYLDFINMFLALLRIFGRSRD
jgi:FtsH-binding integral membrane protein